MAAFTQDFTQSLNAAFTFSRAGSANYFGSNGLLQSASTNVPRLDYGSPGSATLQGLLLEDTRTNRLLQCRNANNASWTKTTMTAALTATGIDGAANSATTLTSTSANGKINQAVTLSATGRVFSVYLKRISGTGNVQISVNNSTFTTVTLTTSYQRFKLAATAANPNIAIRLVTSGDSIAMDYAQLEESVGSFTGTASTCVTSPILTTTVAVTRPADVLYIASPAFYNQTSGSYALKFITPQPPVQFDWIVSIQDTTHGLGAFGVYQLEPASGGSGTTFFAENDNDATGFDGVNDGEALTPQPKTWIVASRYLATNWGFAVNGTFAGNSLSLSLANPVTPITPVDTILFGNGLEGTPAPIVHLVSFQYFNTPLTDAQLTILSAGGVISQLVSPAWETPSGKRGAQLQEYMPTTIPAAVVVTSFPPITFAWETPPGKSNARLPEFVARGTLPINNPPSFNVAEYRDWEPVFKPRKPAIEPTWNYKPQPTAANTFIPTRPWETPQRHRNRQLPDYFSQIKFEMSIVLAVAESFSTSVALTQNVNKAISVSVSFAEAIAKAVTLATFSEAFSTSVSYANAVGKNVAVAFSTSESFTRAVTYIRTISESWSTAEALAKNVHLNKSESWQTFEEFRRKANGIISDMILRNDALTLTSFTNECDSGHPPGYEDFRDFLQGNYDYTNALFRVILQSGTTDRAAITALVATADTPDILDGGEATITNASTGISITFNRVFHVAPVDIKLTLKGGASTNLAPEYSSVTTTSMVAKLRDTSNALQTGTVSWSVRGR